jgi:hypothetical protein
VWGRTHSSDPRAQRAFPRQVAPVLRYLSSLLSSHSSRPSEFALGGHLLNSCTPSQLRLLIARACGSSCWSWLMWLARCVRVGVGLMCGGTALGGVAGLTVVVISAARARSLRDRSGRRRPLLHWPSPSLGQAGRLSLPGFGPDVTLLPSCRRLLANTCERRLETFCSPMELMRFLKGSSEMGASFRTVLRFHLCPA